MTRRGMTLIELVVVLAILIALSGAVVAMTDQIDSNARYEESARRLAAIRSAILGPDATTSDGRLVHGGYLQDVGSMPGDLKDLVRRPTSPAIPPYDADKRCGWRGPYLTPLPLRHAQDDPARFEAEPALYDDWGTDFRISPAADALGIEIGSVSDPTRPRIELFRNEYRVDLPSFSLRIINRTSIDFSAATVSGQVRIVRPVDGVLGEIPGPSFAIALRPAGQADDTWDPPDRFPATPDLVVGRRRLVLFNTVTGKPFGDSGEGFGASADLPLSQRIQPDEQLRLDIVRK